MRQSSKMRFQFQIEFFCEDFKENNKINLKKLWKFYSGNFFPVKSQYTTPHSLRRLGNERAKRVSAKTLPADPAIYIGRCQEGRGAGAVCTCLNIRSANFLCFLKTFVLQWGIWQNCRRIENHYFQFTYKLWKK